MPDLSRYDFAANIHCFDAGEQTLLLDVNSGAIHVLDPIAKAFVQQLEREQGDVPAVMAQLDSRYGADALGEIWGELSELQANGALFTEKTDLSAVPPVTYIKALCLNVAHACNMACTYCFAGQGNFGLKPALMDLATAQRAIDFLWEHSGDIRHLEVDFFGGEPLLSAAMLKDLVRYTREKEKSGNKRVNFTLTTNATLLDETMTDFIIEENISVILSLDGRPQVNDRHRVFRDGTGTYARVLPRIRNLVERGPVSCYVRGTFTRKNKDFAEDLAHLADLGFDCLSLEPAVGSEDLSIRAEDLPEVLAEYEHLTRKLLDYHRAGRAINFFHYNLQLQGGPCLAKRGSGCGAGTEYLAVTPEGDIYPCHQLVGEENFLMGNVYGEVDAGIRQRFTDNQLEDKLCRTCWTRYFCGGGCHANAYFKGDMKVPDPIGCAMHQKRVEQAIYLEIIKSFSF